MATILNVKNPATKEWVAIPVVEGKPGQDGINKIMVNGMVYEAVEGSIKLPDYATAVPSNLSSFNNDLNFITNTVDNLTNYYTKTDVYNKEEVNNLVSNKFTYEFVNTLPAIEDAKSFVIYMLDISTAEESLYEQYILNTDMTELVAIGTTKIDLSDYITTTVFDNALANKQDKFSDNIISDINSINSKANKLEVYDKNNTYSKEELDALIVSKQDALVSGTNIKTINGESILGNGNVVIEGGGITDAPSDDKSYVRKNASWTALEATSISDAVTFTSTDIIDNKITINHNRNSSDVIVIVYSDTNLVVLPTEIKIIDVNSIELDLTDITVENTWRVIIQGGDALIGAEYITAETLEVDTLKFNKLETTAEELILENITKIDTRTISTENVELKTGYTFPTIGNYIGYEGDNLALSESGKVTYLSNNQFTQDEWDALTATERENIGMADIVDDTSIPLFTPVYTVSQWNALSDVEKLAIDSADVVED